MQAFDSVIDLTRSYAAQRIRTLSILRITAAMESIHRRSAISRWASRSILDCFSGSSFRIQLAAHVAETSAAPAIADVGQRIAIFSLMLNVSR